MPDTETTQDEVDKRTPSQISADMKEADGSLMEGFFDVTASQLITKPQEEHVRRSIIALEKQGTSGVNFGVRNMNLVERILILVWCLLPSFLLIFFFSDVFDNGISTYSDLFALKPIGNALVSLGFLLCFIFYICDFSQWGKKVKLVSVVILGYIMFIGGICMAKTQPQAPFIVLLWHTPILLVIQCHVCSKKTFKTDFYYTVGISCLLTAVIVMIVWVLWIVQNDRHWSKATQEDLIKRSKVFYDEWATGYDKKGGWTYEFTHDNYCGANKVGVDSVPPVDEDELLAASKACAKAKITWYLIWVCPMVCGACLFVCGIFSCLRANYYAEYLKNQGASKTEGAIRLVMITFGILVMGMWVSASIAGASMRLSSTLSSFIMGFAILMGLWAYFELGHANVVAAAYKSKMVMSVIRFACSDLARAFFLLTVNCFIPPIMFVNACNQCVRKCRGTANNKGCFTEKFENNYNLMKQWNWFNILVYTNYCSLAYFSLMVLVARFTYVFLSWLNSQLQSQELIAVIILFFAIGFTMFMLPPVPGVPVYITGGIILGYRGMVDGWFWGGIFLAVGLGYTLKLTAVAGQWFIGKMAGKSVKIQKMVGVDSIGIRAIEDILKTRGLSVPKVAILVGGPDWPTSVLCGILKLNVFQCMLGTAPCIFIAAPCVLAGAFLVKAGAAEASGDGGSWGAIAGTTLAIASLGQGGAGMAACYYMTAVMNAKADELSKPRPEHKPVEDLTKAEEAFREKYKEVSHFDNLNGCYKKVLQIASGISMFAFFCLVWFDKYCFRPFSLTSNVNDSYADGGLRAPGEKHGNALNIVTNEGMIVCLMFIVGTILLKFVLSHVSAETKRQMKSGGGGNTVDVKEAP